MKLYEGRGSNMNNIGTTEFGKLKNHKKLPPPTKKPIPSITETILPGLRFPVIVTSC